ncbi:MAG: hydantoinase/oxoprolinase family protein [Chloroflexi bacterium]|nr:hydantoinase/oxoprolinase family protein [Chloroflexota bacterium]
MSVALGIDTGGTYTDAVLVDYESGRVLAAAKALTTKHNLAIGIRNALARVLSPERGGPAASDVHLVSISTTLATNAIVEGNGAPVCMLLIGYRGRVADGIDWAHELGTPRYVFISGGHTTDGQEYEPLDIEAAREAIREHAPHVSAFGVSGYFGTRNPAHELAVAALVRELTGLPVTSGHELTHRLHALRRAATVALNGRLIPLLCNLIDAVEATMKEWGIVAPLMVVKGDGSLMAASMARERPIETILSGPAASVVGAQHLAGEAEAVVADMGGTTTDIAVISGGRPRLNVQGARVGRWRTMVEAIDVHTVGLGGDSRIWLGADRELRIGPRRVVPLCLLAAEHPETVEVLEEQLRRKPNAQDGEFLLMQRRWSGGNGNESDFEAMVLAALAHGPRSLEQMNTALQYPALYARHLLALEDQGILVRAGLTPTDAAHVLGAYTEWDERAAQLGAALLARRLGCDSQTLCRRVLAQTSERVAVEVIAKLLEDAASQGEDGSDGNGHVLDSRLIAQALRPTPDAALMCQLVLRPALVGIGAPVATYFPRAAELLHGRLRIPEYAEVANAIGAVVGSVVCRVHALVVPDPETETFRVHLPDEATTFRRLDTAVCYAEERARHLATEGARAAGAAEVRLQVERRDRSAPVAEDWGEELFLEAHIQVTAVGRPRLADD